MDNEENVEQEGEGLWADWRTWVDWEAWERLIISDRAIVLHVPGRVGYQAEGWTRARKHAPFPFNLEPTWYCAALLTFILAIHTELHTEWLLQHERWQYLMRILSRTMLTVAISFISTLLFDVCGNIMGRVYHRISSGLEESAKDWFVGFLGWEIIHENPYDNSQRDFLPNKARLRDLIRRMAVRVLMTTYDYFASICLYLLPSLIGSLFLRLMALISTDFADSLSSLSIATALPTPLIDGTSDMKTLLWEFGIPALLQLLTATFIYICVFLFMAIADTPAHMREGVTVPFYRLALHLLRATVQHLLSYTAYQLVCIIDRSEMPWIHEARQERLFKDSSFFRLLRAIAVEISPSAGIHTFVAHYIIWSIFVVLIRRSWPLWAPYIAWLSLKTETGTQQDRPSFDALLDVDMGLLSTALQRALMTFLFGLKSSWPIQTVLGQIIFL
ncbi:hypothetical protein F5Y13DRAFT_192558 [Hypoxylon sp. FL1857]|nr:hypothetical protein F5Y13DRAFT_192558 [Hypoxylon sp. FL1857]